MGGWALRPNAARAPGSRGVARVRQRVSAGGSSRHSCRDAPSVSTEATSDRASPFTPRAGASINSVWAGANVVPGVAVTTAGGPGSATGTDACVPASPNRAARANVDGASIPARMVRH